MYVGGFRGRVLHANTRLQYPVEHNAYLHERRVPPCVMSDIEREYVGLAYDDRGMVDELRFTCIPCDKALMVGELWGMVMLIFCVAVGGLYMCSCTQVARVVCMRRVLWVLMIAPSSARVRCACIVNMYDVIDGACTVCVYLCIQWYDSYLCGGVCGRVDATAADDNVRCSW